MDTHPPSLQQFKDQLQAHGYSVTKARLAVFKGLQYGPLSNAELGDRLDGSINRSSVYRTLELFETLSIVKRIWRGFKSQVELSEAYLPHHHHASCKQCGRHITITSPLLENTMVVTAAKIEFELHDHHLELVGICRDCR